MNIEEIILMYNIQDPVYKGLVRWRAEMIADWYRRIMRGNVKRVLEIGTGNYPFSLAIGDETKEMDFVGIERDMGQKVRAEVHLLDRFRTSEMHNCLWNSEAFAEIGQGAFDLACSFEVYEHVPADQRFLENVARALRSGGYAIIETPNAQVTPLFEQVFGHSPDGAGNYEGNEHVNELGFRELFNDFRRNGFEVLDFNCFYLPVSLWQDAQLQPWQQTRLYELVHASASKFPFYSYVQSILAVKK